MAANELGWELVGVRDGFDGLLWPDRYPYGGLVPLSSELVDSLAASGGSILGNSTRTDVETLDRMRLAAQSAARIGVVEALGEHSGWLALQAGIAVCADAVLIPEISYDLCKVAARLRQKARRGTASGLGALQVRATGAHQGHARRPRRAAIADYG
jgi:6-phosphofructokinase